MARLVIWGVMVCLGFRHVSGLKGLIERIPVCFIQRLRQCGKIDQVLHRKCRSLLGYEWWLRMRAAVSHPEPEGVRHPCRVCCWHQELRIIEVAEVRKWRQGFLPWWNGKGRMKHGEWLGNTAHSSTYCLLDAPGNEVGQLTHPHFTLSFYHIKFSLRPRIWKTLRESAPDQIRNYCAPRAMKSSRGCPLRQFIHEQGVKALSIDLW